MLDPGLLQVPRVASRAEPDEVCSTSPASSSGDSVRSQRPLAFGGSTRRAYDSEDDEIDLEDSKDSDEQQQEDDEDDDGQGEYISSYESAWDGADDDDVALGINTSGRERDLSNRQYKAHHTWDDLPRFWVEYFNISQKNFGPKLSTPQDDPAKVDIKSSFVPLAPSRATQGHKEEEYLIHRPVEVPFPFCQRFENEGVCEEPTCGLFVSDAYSLVSEYWCLPLSSCTRSARLIPTLLKQYRTAHPSKGLKSCESSPSSGRRTCIQQARRAGINRLNCGNWRTAMRLSNWREETKKAAV